MDEFGGSLPVENVQALASKKLRNIPSRYLRTEAELGQRFPDESLSIPVIDMNKLMDNQPEELEKLHLACKQWGFFQLINHGVGKEVIENMRNDVQAFFKLPLEKKSAYAQQPNDMQGYGQAFVISEDQKLDWGDMFFLVSQPESARNLRFWPTMPNSFRNSLDEYSKNLQAVTKSLLTFSAKNLGLYPERLTELFENGMQHVRMNYYPPCNEASKVLGLSPHSDAVGLTLLLQANEIEGLQIKINEKWIPIKPVTGAFTVNIGDIFEIMTNGTYKSVEHRAVVNPHVERISVAAFHGPNMATRIGPLPEISHGNANYKSLDHRDYLRIIRNSKLDGKNRLEKMKL